MCFLSGQARSGTPSKHKQNESIILVFAWSMLPDTGLVQDVFMLSSCCTRLLGGFQHSRKARTRVPQPDLWSPVSSQFRICETNLPAARRSMAILLKCHFGNVHARTAVRYWPIPSSSSSSSSSRHRTAYWLASQQPDDFRPHFRPATQSSVVLFFHERTQPCQ